MRTMTWRGCLLLGLLGLGMLAAVGACTIFFPPLSALTHSFQPDAEVRDGWGLALLVFSMWATMSFSIGLQRLTSPYSYIRPRAWSFILLVEVIFAGISALTLGLFAFIGPFTRQHNIATVILSLIAIGAGMCFLMTWMVSEAVMSLKKARPSKPVPHSD